MELYGRHISNSAEKGVVPWRSSQVTLLTTRPPFRNLCSNDSIVLYKSNPTSTRCKVKYLKTTILCSSLHPTHFFFRLNMTKNSNYGYRILEEKIDSEKAVDSSCKCISICGKWSWFHKAKPIAEEEQRWRAGRSLSYISWLLGVVFPLEHGFGWPTQRVRDMEKRREKWLYLLPHLLVFLHSKAHWLFLDGG